LIWTQKVLRDRNETRRWMKERGLQELPREKILPLWEFGAHQVVWARRPMPFSMRLIGENGLYAVGIPTDIELSREERERIEYNFPEAGFMPIGGY
jgi:hypothetical protein